MTSQALSWICCFSALVTGCFPGESIAIGTSSANGIMKYLNIYDNSEKQFVFCLICL